MESVEQAIVTSSSPPPSNGVQEVDSQFSSVIFDLSQQVQGAMEDLLKMINEIEVQSADVTEEMEKCKESALERRKTIEEEKECFQKTAFAVLNVLNSGEGKQDEQTRVYKALNTSDVIRTGFSLELRSPGVQFELYHVEFALYGCSWKTVTHTDEHSGYMTETYCECCSDRNVAVAIDDKGD